MAITRLGKILVWGVALGSVVLSNPAQIQGAARSDKQGRAPADVEIPATLTIAISSDQGDAHSEVETGSGAENNSSFAPSVPTIWNVNPGQDQLVGKCGSDVKPINYCPSLVQLVPRGTGLLMKDMALTPTHLRRVRENVYSYSGPAPTVLGRGTVTLTLVFTSEKTWTTTRVLQLRNQQGCQHVYTFTGTFLR